MRLRTRQIATVMALVSTAMGVLAILHLSTLIQVRLDESAARAELLTRTVFQHAQQIVSRTGDVRSALRTDPGLRATLDASIAYTRDVAYVTIVDTEGVAIVHSSPSLEGVRQPAAGDLQVLLGANVVTQLRQIYGDTTLEITEPLQLGAIPFGAIRVGLSPVLLQNDLEQSLRPAALILAATLVVALLVALILTRWALAPIHVIRAGLNRLQHGDASVHLDVPADPAFTDLTEAFHAISARLSNRSPAADQTDHPAPAEDAVALVDRTGTVRFANATMRTLVDLPEPERGAIAPSHPCHPLLRTALDEARPQGPAEVFWPGASGGGRECAVMAYPIRGDDGRVALVLLIARDLRYLRAVESTLTSSRQLASLGQMLAGVAHEVKNPLHGMLIQLELLTQLLEQQVAGENRPHDQAGERAPMAPTGSSTDAVQADVSGLPVTSDGLQEALRHASLLGHEIERLDRVIQALLRFLRPDTLRKTRLRMRELVDEVFTLIQVDAERHGVTLDNQCSEAVPPALADDGMIRQALLNLALNAVDAMPSGGTLRIDAGTEGSTLWVDIADTGIGISPSQMERMFELYYTTKPGGSGIGLSMVYRIIQLHGGDIDVESTPGRGTRIRLYVPLVADNGMTSDEDGIDRAGSGRN